MCGYGCTLRAPTLKRPEILRSQKNLCKNPNTLQQWHIHTLST